jgi:hypothetical protein
MQGGSNIVFVLEHIAAVYRPKRAPILAALKIPNSDVPAFYWAARRPVMVYRSTI